jgi:hypothetical protein
VRRARPVQARANRNSRVRSWQPDEMHDEATDRADTGNRDAQTHAPTIHNLQSELDALVDAGIAAQGSKIFIYANEPCCSSSSSAAPRKQT